MPAPTSVRPDRPPPDSPAWHALAPDQAVRHLESHAERGLPAGTAARRLAEHGPNALPEAPPRPLWRTFARQFASPLIAILFGAAALAVALGHQGDAGVILAVVLVNALIGTLQEGRAERSMAALRRLSALQVRVLRDGAEQVVAARELVPGDLMLLAAGDAVAADARVLDHALLQAAEAALTGESHAVGKTAGAVDGGASLAERVCMVFMNTVITRGRIEAVVTATGMHTEMGRLAGLLAETAEGETPLQIQLDGLGKRLAIIATVVVGLMFFMGLMRGDELIKTAMTAIALAVAAIPEGLPAVVTVTLALGMHRMAKRNAIVKKLAAVETLGCTTVICSGL